MKNGFCGQCVDVQVPLSKLCAVEEICAYARFMGEETATTVDSLPKVVLDESIEVRSKNNPCSEWIRVAVSVPRDGQVLFKINPDLLGWHYDWRSNKNTRTRRHVLRLYVFRVFAGTELKLILEVGWYDNSCHASSKFLHS